MNEKHETKKEARVEERKNNNIMVSAFWGIIMVFFMAVFCAPFVSLVEATKTPNTNRKIVCRDFFESDIEEVVLDGLFWANITVHTIEVDDMSVFAGDVQAVISCSEEFFQKHLEVKRVGRKLMIASRADNEFTEKDLFDIRNFSLAIFALAKVNLTALYNKSVDIDTDVEIGHLRVAVKGQQRVDAIVVDTVSGFIGKDATVSLYALMRNGRVFIDGGTLTVLKPNIEVDEFLPKDRVGPFDSSHFVLSNQGQLFFERSLYSMTRIEIDFIGDGDFSHRTKYECSKLESSEQGAKERQYQASRKKLSYALIKSPLCEELAKTYPVFWSSLFESLH